MQRKAWQFLSSKLRTVPFGTELSGQAYHNFKSPKLLFLFNITLLFSGLHYLIYIYKHRWQCAMTILFLFQIIKFFFFFQWLKRTIAWYTQRIYQKLVHHIISYGIWEPKSHSKLSLNFFFFLLFEKHLSINF